MQQGLDFSDAYRTVISHIPPARIREIQEESLFVIDTKYRFMETLLKISGVTGTILLIFGAMLKIQHLPGAGILMSAGAIILAFLFLPASLSVLWKETHNRPAGSVLNLQNIFLIRVHPQDGRWNWQYRLTCIQSRDMFLK
jgi:hypothetical protein